MNKSNAAEFIPLVQAVAGGTLQIRCGDKWVDVEPEEEVIFVYELERYRVKPKPRERWIVEVPTVVSAPYKYVFSDEQEACRFATGVVSTAVHFREVVE